MADINQIYLKGFIVKNCELKTNPQNIQYCLWRIAVPSYNRHTKERKADFFRVLTNGWDAENLADNGKKGTLVFVSGRLKTQTYRGKDGQKHFGTTLISRSVDILQKFKGNENITAQQAKAGQAIEPDQPEQEPVDQSNSQTNQAVEDPFANSDEALDLNESDIDEGDVPFF